ncbi:replication protein A 70 kDa DNA-binding subunit B [Tanacetum coccineum]|uniref:Replication protein A 70 kDa DNA-binding subunit B n=1 Tax=Tanacetum coccineum TaxID=301880 RepID=A0ABQ5CSX3_9ASTR
MARFDNGFLSDLTAVRDNIILRVRIVRTSMQPMFNNPKVINTELIIMDEQGAKMHAAIRSKLVSMFKQQLNEGDAVILRMYSLGQTQPAYRVVPNPIKLNFFLKSCDDVGLLIVVIQLGKMKKWDGAMQAPDEFLTKYPLRNIDELIDLPKGKVSVIMATIILIQEGEVWWYLGCRKCNKKVVRVDEVLDPKDKDTSDSIKGTNGFFCKTYDVPCSNVCRVQDETGTASLVLFEKDVKSLLDGNSAYQLLATQERNGKLDEFPSDFNRIIDRKSDVAVKDTNVPQLDLASVMDDNGTPFELLKSITSTPNNSGSTNKCNGDGVLGDEGSNTKRQLIEEMGEKN